MRRLAVLLLLLLPLSLTFGADSGLPGYQVPESLLREAADPSLVTRHLDLLLGRDGDGEPRTWRVLAGIGRPAVGATIRALPEAGWFRRSLLMTALAESGVPEVESVLLAGLADPSWAVREAATTGLSDRGGDPVTDRLILALEDPAWRVRRAAAVVLRERVARERAPRERVVPHLLELAQNDPDEDVRFGALQALGLLREAAALPLFAEGYLELGTRERRSACLTFLTHAEGTTAEILVALERALTSSDEAEFLAAAEKVAEIDADRLLRDEDHVFRLLSLLREGASVPAAAVFRKLGEPAVPLLLADLRDFFRRPTRLHSDPHLASTVLDLVQSILGEDAAPVLAAILRDWQEAPTARQHAALLIRRYHGAALVESLKKLYPREEMAQIRVLLFQAIATAEPPELPSRLAEAILSGEDILQKAALRILLERPDLDLSTEAAQALRAEGRSFDVARRALQILSRKDRKRAFEEARLLLDRDDPAFRALGAEWVRVGTDPAEVLAVLEAVYDEPREGDEPDERGRVIRQVLTSARMRAGPAAAPLLVRAARDPWGPVREQALSELARLPGPEGLEVALSAVATDEDPAVRRQGWRFLVARPEPSARSAVKTAFVGEDPLPRREVLQALRVVEGAVLPPELTLAMKEDNFDPEARELAVEVIARGMRSDRQGLLMEIARRDPAPPVQAAAIRALGEIGDPTAVPVLVAFLPGPGETVESLSEPQRILAAHAIEALGLLGSEEAADPLLSLLDREWPLALADRTADLRHFHTANLTLDALGRIGDPGVSASLIRRLFSPAFYQGYRFREADGQGGRSLLGTLLLALVRFPDSVLVKEARGVISDLRENGQIYRVDEAFLLDLSDRFLDPRREQGRGIQPRPRRGMAELLSLLVLEVVPRDGEADLLALDRLTSLASERTDFEAATQTAAAANRLRPVVRPLDWAKSEDIHRASALLYEASALLGEGRLEEGLEVAKGARALDPEEPTILNLFGWLLAVSGHHLDLALEAAVAAGRRSGSQPHILDTLGFALHRLGRHAEAAVYLAEAEKLHVEGISASGRPDRFPDPIYAFHLAAAESMAGNLEQAQESLARALRMDDTLADAARSSPDFEPLRKADLLEPVIEAVLGRE